MKADYEAGALEHLTRLHGPGKRALFRDRGIGHAGPMMQDICALVWLHFLYGARLGEIDHGGYDQSDVTRIVSEAIAYNRQFLDR